MDKGAHFYKCDLQVHTPRDRQWHGERPITDIDRQDYARDFIAACRARELHTVAITDHHDMAFISYLRQAALNEVDSDGNPVSDEQRILIFPGMELTLGIPCQALIIFDADFPNDMFNLVTTCLAISPADPSEPQCNELIRLDRITSLDMLYEELDKHNYLKGHYIVFPNVSEGGNSTLLRSGHAAHYKNMPCIGGYLDGAIDQLGDGNISILEGRDTNYGNKPLAVFQTSDNRRRDFADLGSSATWVKWAQPTAEALRQACLARESRISQDKPLIPPVAITSLNVSNSSFMGPIYLEFNNQYNAIIGGRGTGKSTILEYIRWALCDEPRLTMGYEELPSYEAKRDNLVRQTLTALNANVQVNFIVNGVPHSVRRDSANGDLTLKIGGGNFESCSESDVRNLLPVQTYSQKQLSSVGVRLEELTRFVHAPIRQQLDDLNLQFNQVALEMRSAYSSLQQKRTLQKEVDNDQREFQSLTERVKAIRGQLKGIGKKEQLILSQYDQYVKEEEIVAAWTEQIGSLRGALINLKQLASRSLGNTIDLQSLPNAAILQAMREQFTLLLESLTVDIEENLTRFLETEEEGDPFFIAAQKLKAKHDEFDEAYEAAIKKSAAHETTLNQLRELEERLGVVRKRLTANKSALSAAGAPEVHFSNLREQWCTIHDHRSQLVDEQCTRMTELSNGQIRAMLKKGANVDGIAERLKGAVTGANIRGTKIDDLCSRIAMDADPIRKYQIILNELELLALRDVDDPSNRELAETASLSGAGFTGADLDRVSQRLAPESWLELCLTRIDDEPVFEYRTREDEYIAFADASAGQQATSLLTALLNQGGIPLIIDQPEDDLDNKVILDIVKQIWKAKQARQLIFSSHNANLVVNGDAELVACCDYRVAGEQSAGHIKHQGAIDVEDIRNEITNVMEGGQEAFRLRKQKYGF